MQPRCLRLLVLGLLLSVSSTLVLGLRLPHPAQAAGVVGTGTAASCTEAAYDAAVGGGGLVTFNCGPSPITITVTSTLAISAATTTTIDGGGLITLSGGGSVEFFDVNTSLTLQNLTLTDGYTNFAGGAIVSSGTLTLTNVTLSGNTASGGVSKCVENGFGGAIANTGTATLTNVTLSGNTASGDGTRCGQGGAIGNFGTLMLTNVTLSGNTASGNGVDSGIGGAIAKVGGTATLTNVTLSGNTASGSGNDSGDGGGIANFAGAATLTNVTLSGNTANGGGGITNGAIGTLILQASIIADSPSGGDCLNFPGGSITSIGANIADDNTCVASLTGPGDLNNTNPLLGPLQNNGGHEETQALLAGSPAIDHVSPTLCPPPATDERGVSRPQGAACDSGAFEAVQAAPTAPSKTCSPAQATLGGSTSCTITVGHALYTGDLVTDVLTSPSGATITACGDETGGLVCGTPSGNSVSVTCTPPSGSTCPSDAGFQVTISSTRAGPLLETVTIKGQSFPLMPVPPVSFGEPESPRSAPVETAPTKRCTPAAPSTGQAVTCTLTLTHALGPTSYLTDTLSSPSGPTFSGCSATGGLQCQTLGSNATSVTITCPGPSPCLVGATVTLTLTSTTPGSLSESVAITPAGFLAQRFTVTPNPAVSFTVATPPVATQLCNGQVLPLAQLCPSAVSQPSGPQPLPVVIPFPPGLS